LVHGPKLCQVVLRSYPNSADPGTASASCSVAVPRHQLDLPTEFAMVRSPLAPP